MNRRSFLSSAGLAAAGAGAGLQPAAAAVAKMKITRVRAYAPPELNPLFNQSNVWW